MRNCCAGAAATPTTSGLPGETRLYVLRSPHAAARIRGIDATAARAVPGVLAVYTGADLVADGIGGLPSRARRQRPDGKPNHEPPYRALAHERVRVVGDPVVAVVAETLAAAKEAAELVAVDYEPLPAVTDTAAAAAPGAPAGLGRGARQHLLLSGGRRQGRGRGRVRAGEACGARTLRHLARRGELDGGAHGARRL